MESADGSRPAPTGHGGDLAGRVAVVTGGSGVIGRQLCLALASAGAAVTAADIRSAEKVVSEIESAGGQASSVEVDVSDPASTEAMAAAVIERFGRLDILINNAAYFRTVYRGPFENIPVDEWEEAFAVNVRGAWLCARAAVPHMRHQGEGRVVNVGSNTVFRGVPYFMHYVASKAALIGVTRAMAQELGDDGIAVNLLCPDFIPDDDLNARQPGNNERLVAQRCFKRTQVPEDLAGAVLFLTGPGSAFMTGQSLVVNGGAYFL